MQIACERCGAIHDLELPKGVLEKGRSVRFRCTSCGHGFKVAQQGALVASPPSRTSPANPASPALSNPSPLVAGAAMILRQEGAAYHIPNIATLQRWVAERRVNELDELDLGGGNLVQAKDLPELRVFFELVQIAEQPTTAAQPTGRGPELPSSQPQPPRAIAPSLPLSEPTPESEPPETDEDGAEPAPSESESADLNPDQTSAVGPTTDGSPDEAAMGDWAPPAWASPGEDAAPADTGWSPPSWANEEVPPDGATEEVGATGWAPPAWAAPESDKPASSESSGWSPPSWAAAAPETKPAETGGWAPPSWASPTSDESSGAAGGWAPPSWAKEEPKKPTQPEPSKPQRPQEDSLVPDVGDEAWSAPLEGVSPEDAPVPAKARPIAAAAAGQAGNEELEDWFSDNAFEDPDDAPAPDPVISPAPWDLPAVEPEKPPARKEKVQETPAPKPEPRPAPPPSPPEPPPPKPWIWVGLAFAAVAIGAVFLWRPSTPPPVVPPPVPEVVAPAPVPTPTPPAPQPLPVGADPQPTPPPAPAPPPEVAPAPPPTPTPSPKVAAEETREVGVQATINKGWKYVSSKNWEAAEAEFRKAISQRENSGPAHYGLGYVLDRKGDPEGSLRELCRAQRYAGSDAELRREITAGLNRLGKECD